MGICRERVEGNHKLVSLKNSSRDMVNISMSQISGNVLIPQISSNLVLSSRRDVSVGAGKKKKPSPGGRLEGPRRKVRVGPPQEWLDKAISEADVVYNDDYYKYGHYGPYSSRGLIHGEPVLGDSFDPDSVDLYTSVRDEDEREAMDKREQCMIFEKKLNLMEDDANIHFYYVFARSYKPTKRRDLPPWKEWTLAANVAVESATVPDKWEVGDLVDLRTRHGVTRCVAWVRPDLIYVKKPGYQMRYQPQEEYIAGLFKLLNPKTETEGIPGKDEQEKKKHTFYYKLCEKLGVQQTASEAEILSAFENLENNRRNDVMEHILYGQPTDLLHPFTKAYRRHEAQGRKSEYSENLEEDEEEFVDESETDESEEYATEDDATGEYEVNEDGDDGEDEYEEAETEVEYETEFNEDEPLDTDEGDFYDKYEGTNEESEPEPENEESQGDAGEEELPPGYKRFKDDYFGGKGNPLNRRDLEPWEREWYKAALPSRAEIKKYPKELYHHHFDHLDNDPDEKNNWVFEPGTGLKAAVRPFTYEDLLLEILFIRRQYAYYN